MAVNHSLLTTIDELKTRLQALKPRQDDERHGLLLCLASRINNMVSEEVMSFEIIMSIFDDAKTTKYRREDLVAEALSSLITASCKRLPIEEAIKLGAASRLLLDKWLRRNENEVVDTASEAASQLFQTLHKYSSSDMKSMLLNWITVLDEPQGGKLP
jgi:hypothetical protein